MDKIEHVNPFDAGAFGGRLREARRAVRPRLSQAAVAASLGVEQPSVSRWENGDVVPDVGQVARMCRLYGVSVGEVLLGEANAPDAVLLRLAERTEAVAVALRALATGSDGEVRADLASLTRRLVEDARESAHSSGSPKTAGG